MSDDSAKHLDEMINSVEGQSKFSEDKIPFLELSSVGAYTITILPFVGELARKYPGVKVELHSKIFDPNKNATSVFRCSGTDCPLCEQAKKANAEKDPQAWQKEKRAYVLYYVLDSQGRLKILKAPYRAHAEIEKEWLSIAKSERINIFSGTTNQKIQITHRKNGKYAVYNVKVNLEVEPISQDLMTRLQTLRPLTKCFYNYTNEQLNMVVSKTAWRQAGTRPAQVGLVPNVSAINSQPQVQAPAVSPADEPVMDPDNVPYVPQGRPGPLSASKPVLKSFPPAEKIVSRPQPRVVTPLVNKEQENQLLLIRDEIPQVELVFNLSDAKRVDPDTVPEEVEETRPELSEVDEVTDERLLAIRAKFFKRK